MNDFFLLSRKICVVILILTTGGVKSQNLVVPAWPNGAPESNGITGSEKLENGYFTTNISEAKMFVYLPQSSHPTSAVIICPGGGYAGLTMTYEGAEFAEWLCSQGVAAIVLKYRLPNGHYKIPLSDAQQAFRIVRGNAKKWNIISNKIGIAGFSAGGHLASTVSTHFSDSITRPDFTILFYPVITTDALFTHKGSCENLFGNNPSNELLTEYSNEKQVTDKTPPAILFHCDDDKSVSSRNSIEYYLALKLNKVSSTIYVFPTGNHGWGVKNSFEYEQEWKDLLSIWLKKIR